MESKLIKIGGLWINKSKDGKTTYLSGNFGFAKILVFKNDKRNDKDPDYSMMIAEKPKPEPEENGNRQAPDDDVPF